MDADQRALSSWFPKCDFLRRLYSYRNPTFPTFAPEVIDYAMQTIVG